MPYSKYNIFLRLLMQFIARVAGGDPDTSRDYEYTDWRAVEAFAAGFAERVRRDIRYRTDEAAPVAQA